MKKKGLSLTLAALLAVSLLSSACSNSKPEGTAAGGTQSPGNSAEKVKLVVWIWETAKAGLDLNMDEFKKQYPNIDVEFQLMKSTDLYQKYLISSNTGDAVPDIVAGINQPVANGFD
jgi:lactose/L-arabinose transport system substrate-binding protein